MSKLPERVCCKQCLSGAYVGEWNKEAHYWEAFCGDRQCACHALARIDALLVKALRVPCAIARKPKRKKD